MTFVSGQSARQTTDDDYLCSSTQLWLDAFHQCLHQAAESKYQARSQRANLFFPIAVAGRDSATCGRVAVARNSDSPAVRIPGAIATTFKIAGFETAAKVVAVPKLITISGAPYRCRAA